MKATKSGEAKIAVVLKQAKGGAQIGEAGCRAGGDYR